MTALHDDKGNMVKIDPNTGALPVTITRSDGTVVLLTADGNGNLSGALPSIALPGTVPLNSTSVAYEASRLVKATGGVLFGFAGYNSKASTQFILVFDAPGGPGIPANTAIPVIILPVAAASAFSYDSGHFGRRFSSGIWIANSSTGPTLTIGSADCWIDAQYV